MTLLAAPKDHHVPRSAGTIGMLLFLAALFMLFAGSLLGYALIRVNGAKSPELGALTLPPLLIFSTVLVLGVSIALGGAIRAVRREKMTALRTSLTYALALAVGFVILQAPALYSLLADHWRNLDGGLHLYGLIFVLVLLHALHVVGGLVGLVKVTLGAYAGKYDHEHYLPVYHTALYWHFLDAIWVVMFGLFWILG